MPSYLVDSSELSSLQIIAKHIGDLINKEKQEVQSSSLVETPGDKFQAECGELSNQLQTIPPSNRAESEALYYKIFELLSTQFDLIFTNITDFENLNCVLAHLGSFVNRIPIEHQKEAADKLKQIILSEDQKLNSEQVLQLIVSFYNIVEDPQIQQQIFYDILNYSKQKNLTAQVASALKSQVDQVLKDWNLDQEAESKLLLDIADFLKQSPVNQEYKKFIYEIQSKALKTMDQSSKVEYKDTAKTVLLTYISDLDSFACDVSGLEVVKSLRNDSSYQDVSLLFDTVLNGDCAKCQSSDIQSALSTYGINPEVYQNKVQLMQLILISQKFLHRPLKRMVVEESLKLEEEDVEKLISQAVGKKLLNVNIDDVNGIITFKSCIDIEYGQAQWQKLAKELQFTEENINNFLSMAKVQDEVLQEGVTTRN